LVAGYLTWVHYTDLAPICAGGGGGCKRVQASPYAELAGMPVALIGVIGYAAIAVPLLLPGDAARVTGTVLVLLGFGFSAYLTYIELFEIEAVCQWCAASAALTRIVDERPRPRVSGEQFVGLSG
jgi:uncharacterized membrane protein